MKRLALTIAILPLLMPHVVLAEEVSPKLLAVEEEQAEDVPLDRPFIEVATPVVWESTQLAPPKPVIPKVIARSPEGSRRFPRGQCTDLVARMTLVTWRGHAKDWPRNARAVGRMTGDVPVVGAIGVTNESRAYGHVVFLEEVHADGSFTFVESNYAGLGVITRRTMHPSDPRFVTFIY